MTQSELDRMRNPLSVKNVDRIRKLLQSVDFNIAVRQTDLVESNRWIGEIKDELSSCRVILETWNKRRKRK